MLNFLSLLKAIRIPSPYLLHSRRYTMPPACHHPNQKRTLPGNYEESYFIAVNVGCFTSQFLLWTEFSLKYKDTTSALFSVEWHCLIVKLIAQVRLLPGLDIHFTAEALQVLCACLIRKMMFFVFPIIFVQFSWSTVHSKLPVFLFCCYKFRFIVPLSTLSPTRQHSNNSILV
jgi:hypothetical protein